MTIRQDESVAIWPNRVLRIELHDPVPDRVNQRRQRHGRAGMPGLGLLDGIDRKGADRVYGQLVQFLISHLRLSFVLLLGCGRFQRSHFA